MIDKLTYKVLDAKEVYNNPKTERSQWVDANRFDYKQGNHTVCRSKADARKVNIYDIVFYLDGRQCVAVPGFFNSMDVGYHPNISEGLSIQKPGLNELAPTISDIVEKLIPKNAAVLVNLARHPKKKEDSPTNRLIAHIDYFWNPPARSEDTFTGSAHEMSLCFAAQRDEIPSLVRRYWSRFDQRLPPNHFCAYSFENGVEETKDIMSEWLGFLETLRGDKQRHMREFMEDRATLAIDSNNYGWGIRITSKYTNIGDIKSRLS